MTEAIVVACAVAYLCGVGVVRGMLDFSDHDDEEFDAWMCASFWPATVPVLLSFAAARAGVEWREERRARPKLPEARARERGAP